MPNKKPEIAIIGAGPMGLMCAYELAKKGCSVTLLERDDRIGGMSASFDLGGTKIERFYHFICATDFSLFKLLDELQLSDKLVWQNTKMGFYYDGKLYPWGDPISLLKFPRLNWLGKLRYGLHVFRSKYIRDWSKLDKENAIRWLRKWLGDSAYQVLWDSLFKLKFYEHQHDLSAAWIASRIRRVAKSRKSLMEEKLGYLQGGSDVLLAALEQRITQLGGKIILNAEVNRVTTTNGQVQGVVVGGEVMPFSQVISTIPMPYVSKLVPDLPDQLKQQIASINNVGVACVVLKLSQPYSPYFWMNVNDKNLAIPGIIEYSNLNPEVGNVVYVPYYMPQTHHKYQYKDKQFIGEVVDYLKYMNPAFSESWINAAHVARYAYAQTVCTPGFFEKLPSMKTPIKGLYLADTSFYYPEDRSIAESIIVGNQLAQLAQNDIS